MGNEDQKFRSNVGRFWTRIDATRALGKECPILDSTDQFIQDIGVQIQQKKKKSEGLPISSETLRLYGEADKLLSMLAKLDWTQSMDILSEPTWQERFAAVVAQAVVLAAADPERFNHITGVLHKSSHPLITGAHTLQASSSRADLPAPQKNT